MRSAKSVPQWVVDGASYFPLFDPAGESGSYSCWGKASSRLMTLRRRHYFEMKGPMLVGIMAVSDERLDNIELNVGMVGGASFAEDVQKTWHKWFGFQRPNGW